MKILAIIPIAKSAPEASLTYFSGKDIPPRSIIEIPLRKKKIFGIVESSEAVGDNKASIKELGFSLRKIENPEIIGILPEWLWNSAHALGAMRGESPGRILKALLPEEISAFPPESVKGRFEEYAIQLAESERFDIYKGIIRECLARKQTILFLCPTQELARRAKDKLSRGIEHHTHLAGEKNEGDDKPQLIIGTGKNLLESNWQTVIVEEESSWLYKERRTPYLDVRENAKIFAREKGARIFFGDSFLSLDLHKRITEGFATPHGRLSFRSDSRIPTLVVDMKPKPEESDKKKEFKLLSPELEEMLRYGMQKKKKIFLFSVRRGLAPQTVCKDCQTTVLCERCESPVVLHKRKDENVFICHHCGESRSSEERCKVCESFHLVPLGIATAGIDEALEGLGFTGVIRFDSDTATTSKKAASLIEKWQKSDGSILIGTEMALRFLERQSADFSAIVSMDSLFSIPDFRIGEKVMHIVSDIKSKTKENLLVQTRSADNILLEEALSGDFEGFLRREMAAREKFGYPPFQTFVKITLEGDKEKISEDALSIKEIFADYSPTVFPAFIKSIRRKSLLHILVKSKLPVEKDPELHRRLLTMPPYARVNVSPESLL